jgi:hypothetical protein
MEIVVCGNWMQFVSTGSPLFTQERDEDSDKKSKKKILVLIRLFAADGNESLPFVVDETVSQITEPEAVMNYMVKYGIQTIPWRVVTNDDEIVLESESLSGALSSPDLSGEGTAPEIFTKGIQFSNEDNFVEAVRRSLPSLPPPLYASPSLSLPLRPPLVDLLQFRICSSK